MYLFTENKNFKIELFAGYITSKRGKTYAFDIMINDAKTSSADKKNIEEQILGKVVAIIL